MRETILSLSYIVHYGYFCAMSITHRARRVTPAPSRHPIERRAGPRLRIARPAAAIRKGPWTVAEQTIYLEALANSDAVEAAARAIGRSRSSALAERARNPAFARAWDATLDPKVDLLESLLLDRTIARLEPQMDGSVISDVALRQHAAVSMFFLEARKPELYGKARATGQPGVVDAAPVQRDDPAARHHRIGEVIAAAERRIAEAEAEIASARVGGTTPCKASESPPD